jgi:hypothetical protein
MVGMATFPGVSPQDLEAPKARPKCDEPSKRMIRQRLHERRRPRDVIPLTATSLRKH